MLAEIQIVNSRTAGIVRSIYLPPVAAYKCPEPPLAGDIEGRAPGARLLDVDSYRGSKVGRAVLASRVFPCACMLNTACQGPHGPTVLCGHRLIAFSWRCTHSVRRSTRESATRRFPTLNCIKDRQAQMIADMYIKFDADATSNGYLHHHNRACHVTGRCHPGMQKPLHEWTLGLSPSQTSWRYSSEPHDSTEVRRRANPGPSSKTRSECQSVSPPQEEAMIAL